MTYTIRVEGLAEVKKTLGVNFKPAMRQATKAIALEVQGTIAPYPPATIANSPENPRLRWYERGYGPRWWVISEGAQEYLFGHSKRQHKRTAQGYAYQGVSQRAVLAQARKGRVHGRKTSQQMGRGWGIARYGDIGQQITNRATYARWLHGAGTQAKWAGSRGWITDRFAVQHVVSSGAVKRIVRQAIVGALKQ